MPEVEAVYSRLPRSHPHLGDRGFGGHQHRAQVQVYRDRRISVISRALRSSGGRMADMVFHTKSSPPKALPARTMERRNLPCADRRRGRRAPAPFRSDLSYQPQIDTPLIDRQPRPPPLLPNFSRRPSPSPTLRVTMPILRPSRMVPLPYCCWRPWPRAQTFCDA